MEEKCAPARISPPDLLIVLVIALGAFMASLDVTIVNIALPAIAASLDIPTSAVSWVITSYLIVMVSLLLAASRLGDREGYRKVFLLGFALFTLGSLLCGISGSLSMLVLFRMLQAAGGAMISALGAVMVASSLPASTRGQALGIVAMFASLGIALGPVLGGFLTTAFGWHAIFLVNVPVGILAIALGVRIVPSTPPVSPGGRMDAAGIVLVFTALAGLIYALSAAQDTGFTMPLLAVVGLALALWSLFFLHEKRTPGALLDLTLLANRAFAGNSIGMLLLMMGAAGATFLSPFYLEGVRGLSTDTSGVVMLAFPVALILTAPIAGRVSDSIGTRKVAIAGFAAGALGFFALSTLTPASRIGHVALGLFLLGSGAGIASPPLQSAVMGEAPPEKRGIASGFLRMMMNLGSAVGIPLFGLVATTVLGPLAVHGTGAVHLVIPPAHLTAAFRAAFLTGAAISISALVLLFMTPDTRPEAGGETEPVI
ncbi:MAG: DHA2 family efflux MFS transporter permease subunit [Methanomicrobiales archaeon]|nr:DHA2 family efflux MFS transporter permease subunit [Methanomicrobiales archaeon]